MNRAAPRWPSEPLKAARLSDAVYDVLDEWITSGQMPAGSRLPAERQLASQLGVSRGSVREAVHELELMGLVERRSGRGTIVVAPPETAHGKLLDHLNTDVRDTLELLDFRRVVEPALASLAAERSTRANIARMERLLEEMASGTSDASAAELDQSFHRAVARATHNRLLVRLHEVGSLWLRETRAAALADPQRRMVSLGGHRQILHAIRDGDRDGAHAAASAHIQEVRVIVESGYPAKLRGIDPASRATPDPDGARSHHHDP